MIYGSGGIEGNEGDNNSNCNSSIGSKEEYKKRIELVLVSLLNSYSLLDLILVDISRLSFYSI